MHEEQREKVVRTILLTCGETSGEHHAALVVSEIRRLDPDCRILALGGSELEKAGAQVVFPMEKYAFMGFSEVLAGIPRVLSLERRLKALLRSGEIDLFMPVDYPGLNLRLSASAKRAGVPVLYFISPQVWAWGGWRIGRMKDTVDLMVVILPFEEDLYRRAGIPVLFAGHPMLSEIPAPATPKEAPGEGCGFKVVLFPGSRRQEVRGVLGPMLGAARILKGRFGEAYFRIGVAPLIGEKDMRIPLDMDHYVEPTVNGVSELEGASLTLAASGTVTLQSALSGTPTIVLYRTSALTYFIGRLLVRIPWIAMPNVLAGKQIVPELIQRDATPERIAREAAGILTDGDGYKKLSAELLELRGRLEGTGGAARVAQIAVGMASGESVCRAISN